MVADGPGYTRRMPEAALDRITPAHLRRFGVSRLREGQRAAIRCLLDGRDVMTLMPTGGGKSLTYQLASELLGGAVVVVEPLLALIRDQLDTLAALGVPAAQITGRTGHRALERSLGAIVAGELRLVYTTPERLADERLCERLATAGIGLLAVDEAHCISQWGHGFRPAYLGLGEVARRLGRPVIQGLTATATPYVRDDIASNLGMADPAVVSEGNDRPNLFLEVRWIDDEAQDREELRALLARPEYTGQGIVYTRTVRAARETAAWLREERVDAAVYHGRMRKAERDGVQRAFTGGDLRVVAATNAFGLGVDKPDVRWVVHRDVPATLEAYWQEAGRAGRDGGEARCTLLYRPGDLGAAAFQSSAGGDDDLRRERERGLLEMMRAYAETTGCRRRYVLNYLGEEYDPSACRMCDNSAKHRARDEHPPGDAAFSRGMPVEHERFGRGVIQRVTATTVVVLFEHGVYRRLALELAAGGLLRPA
jgi:ATP-dependent DNA helicase RecQ